MSVSSKLTLPPNTHARTLPQAFTRYMRRFVLAAARPTRSPQLPHHPIICITQICSRDVAICKSHCSITLTINHSAQPGKNPLAHTTQMRTRGACPNKTTNCATPLQATRRKSAHRKEVQTATKGKACVCLVGRSHRNARLKRRTRHALFEILITGCGGQVGKCVREGLLYWNCTSRVR